MLATALVLCASVAPAARANHGAVDQAYGPNGTGQVIHAERGVAFELVVRPYFAPNTLGGLSCLTCRTLSFSQTTLVLLEGFDDGPSGRKRAVLRRFTQNGAIDTRWGDSGRATIEVHDFDAEGVDMAVLPDGRVAVLLELRGPPGELPITGLAMLRPDGTLDPGWGNAGLIRLRAVPDMAPDAIAVDGSDRVLVLGHVHGDGGTVSRGTHDNLRVVRIDRTGAHITRRIDVSRDTQRGFDPDLVAHPDGRIVVSGAEASAAPGTAPEATLHVRRYRPDGTPDPAFSGDGFFERLISGDGLPFHPAELVLQANGGYAFGALAGFGFPQRFPRIVRLTASGAPDTTFDRDGAVLGTRASGEIHGLLVDESSGTILTAGTDRDPGSDRSAQFLLTRYAPDGSYDRTFGDGDGEVKADLAPDQPDAAWDVVAQPSGRLVAVGESGGNIGLAGFHGNRDRDRPSLGVRVLGRSAARARRAGRVRVSVSTDEPVALRFVVRAAGDVLATRYGRLGTPARRRFELAIPRAARGSLDGRIAVRVAARDAVGNTARRTARALLSRAP